MMVEKPKGDQWQTLVIALPLLLAIVGVLMYAEMTAPPVAEVCEQVSTTPVVLPQEEGDDVATIKFGNGAEPLTTVLPDSTPYLTTFHVKTGATAGVWVTTTAGGVGISDPWPATLTKDSETESDYLCMYAVLDKTTLEVQHLYSNINPSNDCSFKMGIYDTSGNFIVGSEVIYYAVDEPAAWVKFPLLLHPALSDETDYWLVAWVSSPDIVDGQGIGPYEAPAAGVVLPLIKGASDMAAGNSRLIQ